MITYAQNFEDVILARAFGARRRGFYIDVGACFPDVASVTRHFYERGWTGINVEPMEEPYHRLCQDRLRDLNLRAAIADHDGEIAIFPGPTIGESSALRSGAGSQGVIVPCLTLAELCRRHVKGAIDFLKIDVEGLELEVVRGGDWRAYRPTIVVVEVSRPWTSERRPDAAEIDGVLRAARYSEVYYDGLNAFYVADEAAGLGPILACPPNVLDGFQTEREAQFDALAAAAASSAERATAESRRAETLERQFEEVVACWRSAQSLADAREAQFEALTAAAASSAERATAESRRAETLERQLEAVVAGWRSAQSLADASALRAEAAERRAAETLRSMSDENALRAGRVEERVAELKTELATVNRWAESAVTDLTRRVHEAELRAAASEARAGHAEACYASIESSRSWRLMAPLRRLRAALRGIARWFRLPRGSRSPRQLASRAVRQGLRIGKGSRAYARLAPAIRRRFPALWLRARRMLEDVAVSGTVEKGPSPRIAPVRFPAGSRDEASPEPGPLVFPDARTYTPQVLADMIKREAARQRTQ